ncbi:uncharacterized protein LOC142520139 [Primulina tabacum]|uniref:uncharacterized protein LOC142520139 n=1 Tax=Primulina tabacum TaxID=48773 RepID=UPI003F5ABE0F
MDNRGMFMRWDNVKAHPRGGIGGPGVRWGHTCNAIRGGKLLYVFGGYGSDQCQTNGVHVFDTVNMIWSEPVMNGMPPTPRDSHSCTTVGESLFVFGGTDGRRPLNDLHILDTSTNSWITPSVRGDGPEAREGHCAALIGKRLFIFGGCGKSENNQIYYDDLYILNTETFSWKSVVPSGTPPSKRDSHTCSSWGKKIIVIGGEDSCNYYLSDVHILDADTLVWCKLNTTGQLLSPRGGHTTVTFGKNLIVFGGFSDEQNLYNDLYMLDIENGTWVKIVSTGEGPSGRFSMAGENLDPQMGGVLVFIGGCDKNLEALDDMYFLHTGLSREVERDERRIEKLSLRKQLKLKCQDQSSVPHSFGKAAFGLEHLHDTTIYQPMPISSYMPPARQNFYLNEYQTPLGKRTFQAKVTKSILDGYTIETIIDGKPLRGVLFSNKPNSFTAGSDHCKRKEKGTQSDDPSLNGHNLSGESEKPKEHFAYDVSQAGDVKKEKGAEVADSEMMNIAPVDLSINPEVSGASEPYVVHDTVVRNDPTKDAFSPNLEIFTENLSAVSLDQDPPIN